MSFAKNLKKAMATKGITQAELADISGISKSGISQYLSGKYEPKEKVIGKLASALGCTIESLMAEDAFDADGSNKMTVEQAAKILGKSRQFVRMALQTGAAPFGFAVKMSSKWTYHISAQKLLQYVNGVS